MNLDLKDNSSDELIRRKVLYEFGHPLGQEHEHQPPPLPPSNGTKKSSTSSSPDLTTFGVERRHATMSSINSRQSRWFLEGSMGTTYNTRLSKTDKEYMSSVYPAYSSDIGQFCSLQINSPDGAENATDVQMDFGFEPRYASPPRLAMGLSWLECSCERAIDVGVQAEDISSGNLTAKMWSSNAETRFQTAACSWIEVTSDESDFSLGENDVADLWPGGQKQSRTVATISFPTPLEDKTPPSVIETFPSHISPYKFRLSVEASVDTDLHGARVTWALPASKSGYAGGMFSKDDVPGLTNTGEAVFSGGVDFNAVPQVMLTLSGLDFEAGSDLRLRVSASKVTRTGVTWNLDSWGDSRLITASGPYIAICAPLGEEMWEG
ncbi:hypothetical protein F66182_8037 [Fusarium sp. NRRL 66182]|nr:hypothetical protein F66182_8037 [Fusarium sp. NRRL 66182]